MARGYFVDISVTMYQVSSVQDFFPSRKLPLCLRPGLRSLFSCDADLEKRIKTFGHYLAPASFDDIFNTISCWLQPFLGISGRIQDVALSPVFLVTGPNGVGKSLLLQAVSQFLGLSYSRVDCVSVGGAVPGQAEAKLKAIFNQLNNYAPCILQLANIEYLWKDSDSKDDVRIISFFEDQVKTLRPKWQWPVAVVCTSQSSENVSVCGHHLFLDCAAVGAPDRGQRQHILSWLSFCHSQSLEQQTLQAVAEQTSGFLLRDLQVLFTLALKEKFRRSKEKNNTGAKFKMSEFSKIIGLMQKAFSESIGAPKVPSVLWRDVGGLEHLKNEILRSLQSNLFNVGLRRSGLLLHGPPGTGKTLLAKAVATQCGRNFLSVKGPELLNMYVGQSEHNVRDLFELAKVASPCIVFFDELDSLAPNRGRSGDSGGVMDRVVSQLLAEMDDLAGAGDVFILGATNRPDLIDPALLRPGRLDKLLYVGLCEDRESQLSVVTALTRKVNLACDVDLKAVVAQLPLSVSGAQLSALCSAAWLSSATQIIQSGEQKPKNPVAVHQDHFLSAVFSVFSQHDD